jgi:hypothetical protein
MARNGGVRYGLLFAVLAAFFSYTTGVSTHGSVAAELAAALATEGNVEREELRCDHDFSRFVGNSKSYPKSTENVTYCLTIGDSKCWRGKNAAKSMRYHYKGQTNDGKPLCPIAATWVGPKLVIEGKARKGTTFDPSAPFYNGKPSFDKVIINNHGVWRCRHAANSCWCRDEAREVGLGHLLSEHTCKALMKKPFCVGKFELPCFSVPDDGGGAFDDECGFCNGGE